MTSGRTRGIWTRRARVPLATAALALACFVLAVAAGALVAHRPAVAPARSEPESLAVRFTGSIRHPELLEHEARAPGRTFLIGIDAERIVTCEDLGLQLRELARAVAASDRLIVVTDSASRSAVERFLRDERVPASLPYLAGTGIPVTFDGPHPGYPFVALVDGGRIRTGIAHPLRVSTVRPQSFVQELGLSDVESRIGPDRMDGKAGVQPVK